MDSDRFAESKSIAPPVPPSDTSTGSVKSLGELPCELLAETAGDWTHRARCQTGHSMNNNNLCSPTTTRRYRRYPQQRMCRLATALQKTLGYEVRPCDCCYGGAGHVSCRLSVGLKLRRACTCRTVSEHSTGVFAADFSLGSLLYSQRFAGFFDSESQRLQRTCICAVQ